LRRLRWAQEVGAGRSELEPETRACGVPDHARCRSDAGGGESIHLGQAQMYPPGVVWLRPLAAWQTLPRLA